MLPAPARDGAAAFNAKVRRLADSPRTRRLDALEKLWKGSSWDDRPSFWDSEVPLNERGPAVQSSVAEAAGRRLVALVFGNARFPTLKLTDDATAEAGLSPEERSALSALVAALVNGRTGASLKPRMRAALEQGLMVGSFCAVATVVRGRLSLHLLPTKHCVPTYGECGDAVVTSLEYRYRYDVPGPDGVTPVTVWYRRVIDAAADTVWRDVPTDAGGYEPDWSAHAPAEVAPHGLGFCPVYWHRHAPDVSDADPIDGSALFDGLEDEIFALDMAMSQRHRNGRYNGEPQMVRIGGGAPAGSPGASSAGGETGRTADPRAGRFSWFGDKLRAWVGGEPALKKAPGKIWDLAAGADAKLLESSGAGAAILAGDIDGLRRTILESRGIVIASPETIAANASAALMKELYAPMVGVADNLREEYGEALVDLVNLLLRVALTVDARKPGSVRLRGLRAVAHVLARFVARVDDGTAEWLGLPLECAWGEYFEPTWAEVGAAIAAAQVANGGRPVLSHRRSIQLVGPILGVEDVEAELAAIDGVAAADATTTRDLLATVAAPDLR